MALLFVAGWIWPSSAPDASAPVKQAAAVGSQQGPANSMMLRIQSARKWPDRIVFDTSVPTITPPSSAVAETPPPAPVAAANAAPPLDAHAEMKPSAPAPKRQARVARHRAPRPTVSTWATAAPGTQQGWSSPSWSNQPQPRYSWNW